MIIGIMLIMTIIMISVGARAYEAPVGWGSSLQVSKHC